jgi:hypothetical protein
MVIEATDPLPKRQWELGTLSLAEPIGVEKARCVVCQQFREVCCDHLGQSPNCIACCTHGGTR